MATRSIVLLYSLLFVSTSVMATDQAWDKIRFNGADCWIDDCPFVEVVRRNQTKWSQFDNQSTANHKNFTTAWEIKNQKLLLTKFEAAIGGKPVPISDLLPGQELPILADWYSGELHIPIGERPNPWQRTYKRVVVLKIEKGVVVQLDERLNATLESWIEREHKKREAAAIKTLDVKEANPPRSERKAQVSDLNQVLLPLASPSVTADILLKGHPDAERVVKRFGGEEVYNLIQSATKIEAVRIGDRNFKTTTADTAKIKDYSLTGTWISVDDQFRWRLKHLFVDPIGGLTTCAFRPGVRLRLSGGAKQIDILLCFACNKFQVYCEGKPVGGGGFDLCRPDLSRIMKHLFPSDEAIKALEPWGCGPNATPTDKKNPL